MHLVLRNLWLLISLLLALMMPFGSVGCKRSHLSYSRIFAVLQLLRGLSCFLFDRGEATLVTFFDVDTAFLCSHFILWL